MGYHDIWKSDWDLQRERRDLRDDWPYGSYSREQAAEERILDINRELNRREERRCEEEAEERRCKQRKREERERKVEEEEQQQRDWEEEIYRRAEQEDQIPESEKEGA